MDLAVMLFWLVVAHAVCDYPLQGDFLAKSKSDGCAGAPWWLFLWTHATIQAGGTAAAMLLSHQASSAAVAFGAAEFVLHGIIDTVKVRARNSLISDQAAHVACKVAYVAVVAWIAAL